MIKLTPNLVTDFHRSLATPEWIAQLERVVTGRVRAQEELRSDEGEGTLKFLHTADRNLGPESIVKYICVVEANCQRAPGAPLRDHYRASLRWIPEKQEFLLQGERAHKVEGEWADQLRTALRKRMGSPEGVREVIEELRHTACPSCCTKLRIEYYPEGQKWWCFCPNDEGHFNMEGHYENWKDSPMTWKDQVADRTCPTCKSPKDVVGILYGLIRDPSKIDDTIWILGGCSISKERWHCRRCETEW